MFKLFILFLFTYFFVFLSNTFAFSIPVENVFSDININYKYYDELQTLYDKGMITPDINGKFNPSKLLNRDEFVGISMGVSCKKCISPNVAPDFIKLYTNKVSFFDVLPKNKYFYCIAEAQNKNYIKGYDPGYICENGTNKINQTPFCPSNRISLEEAIAVILRNSGIFTIADNQAILNQISLGMTFPDLSTDVKAKNIDGTINSFYPYLKKALIYEYKRIDVNGNTKIYKLLNLKNGKIRPKKSITKEDFLRIAYVALKANSCTIKQNNKLAIQIKILNKSCNSSKLNCDLSTLSSKTNTYDFSMQVGGSCNKGISSTNGYIWRFFNLDTGEHIIKNQKYLDNYSFLSNGRWQVYLRVLDNCGNTGEVFSSITVNTINTNTINTNNNTNNNTNTSTNTIKANNNIFNKGLSVIIKGTSLFGTGPLTSSFTGIVSGGVGPYDFNWNFGNGNTGFGLNVLNVFNLPGVYPVELVVTDSNGLQAFGTISTQVTIANQNCKVDSDLDGINDCLDQCPLVPGDILNNGCPILDQLCTSDISCPTNYICNNSGLNIQGTCTPILNNSTLSNTAGIINNNNNILCLTGNTTSLISGSASCNTCPCSNSLDFKSVIRKCDTIFPAITSPDGTNIYSKGKDFIIQ